MSWSNDYVGLPYEDGGRDRDGLCCFGLLRLVLGEQCGIWIPSLLDTVDAAERAELLAADVGRGVWLPVPVGFERPFDATTFRRGRLEDHVGVVVRPGVMLHAVRGRDSAHGFYDRDPWAGRLTGFYRHRDLRSPHDLRSPRHLA